MLVELQLLKGREDAKVNKNDITELKDYIEGMNGLENKMETFKHAFEQLAEDWEKEIPQFVKNGRDQKSPKKTRSAQQEMMYVLSRLRQGEKPMTVYDQVSLNCRFKSRIHSEF